MADYMIAIQVEFFLKSFIFDLGDDWAHVNILAKKFKEYLNEKAEKHDLDAGQAADFLQVLYIFSTIRSLQLL